MAGTKDFQDLRDPLEWAKFLDKVLKEELRIMGKERLGFSAESLMKELITPFLILPINLHKAIRDLSAYSAICSALLLYIMVSQGYSQESFVAIYLEFLFFSKLIFADLDNPQMKNLKKSLANPFTLGDFEYDRLLVLWHILRTKSLVHATAGGG